MDDHVHPLHVRSTNTQVSRETTNTVASVNGVGRCVGVVVTVPGGVNLILLFKLTVLNSYLDE